jgi:hypoxanthine-guanine phosphoribosyltransferase
MGIFRAKDITDEQVNLVVDLLTDGVNVSTLKQLLILSGWTDYAVSTLIVRAESVKFVRA